jgi:hypothetical protein
MLFSTLSAPSLLLFSSIQATVLANPVALDIDISLLDADDMILQVGVPELVDVTIEAREADPYPDQEELEQLVKRALSVDQQEGLRLHNAARAAKGVPALQWDTTLEANAKAWATNIASRDLLVHSTSAQRPNQGENLAYQRSSRPIVNPVTISTTQWLAEEPLYKNELIPQGNFAGYGHYSECSDIILMTLPHH